VGRDAYRGMNMPTSPTTSVIDRLRRAALLRDGAALSDGELLGRFVEHRDESSLAALVRRHGPMVWGVCRRLVSHHDAEDAFQATFLVLVRKAASIVPRQMVGNWLYGVAHQTALQARRTTARRSAREMQVTVMPDTQAVPQDQWADLQPLLDQELSRLPDNYRAVIVLCDLEDRTRKEVARQLGVAEGTVAGRLARARAMLAKRLAQRGVTLSGLALAAALARNVASADVPNSVMSSTISAANLAATGQAVAAGAISPTVVALTDGVLKAMLMNKLRAVVVLVLVLGFMVTGAGMLNYGMAAQGDQPRATEKAVKSPQKGKEAVTAWDKEVGDLEGEWMVVAMEEGGETASADALKKMKWVVKGNEITATGPDDVTRKMSFKLDPGKGPKEIDITDLDGPFKGETSPGIYTIEGRRLRVCFADAAEQGRPKEFATAPGSDFTMITFEKEAYTVWGKEVGGLQAGLGFHPDKNRVYSPGETVKLVVRVRNVGKEAVKFQYFRQFFNETPPAVTDDKGRPVPLGKRTVLGFHVPIEVNLATGREIELAELKLEPRSGAQSAHEGDWSLHGTGKFNVQYERVIGNTSSGFLNKPDPNLSKLATGKLELEIKFKSEPPAAPKQKAHEAQVPVAKEPAWKVKFHKAYGLKDGEYVKRVPSPFIPERKDFILPRFPGADEKSVDGLLMYGVLFADADEKTVSYRAMVSTDLVDLDQPTKGVRIKRLSLQSVIAYSTGRMTPEVVFDSRAKGQDVFMECDFVIRKGAPLEKLLPDLQKAIGQCELDNPKTKPVLTLREEEQEVYVVRGKFKITPRKWRNKDEVDVYADEGALNKEFTKANPESTADVSTDINTDLPLQFVRDLGSFVNKRMVWEAEAPINLPFRAYMHQRWENKASAEEQAADHDPARVLKNVSEQTGLTFSKEKRKVQVLYVVIP